MAHYVSSGRTVEAELGDATQYATIYSNQGQPVGTLQRAQATSPRGTPNWRLYDTHGNPLRSWYCRTDYQYLLDSAAKVLCTYDEASRS